MFLTNVQEARVLCSYDNKIILQWKNMILNVFYYNLGL